MTSVLRYRNFIADHYPLLNRKTMKELFAMLLLSLFCVTVTAQKIPDKLQVSSKVVLKDGAIQLAAVKSDLLSKHAQAQKLMTELQAMISDMPYEIKTTDKNKAEAFLETFENFDQKANQLFNILSTIIKTTKETENSITDNMN